MQAKDGVEGRIWFEGNPWPGGHRVASCAIVGELHPMRGAFVADAPGPALSLGIELRSADYDEGDLPEERDHVGETDWASKIAWNNYGSAWIGMSASSSTPGFQVSDGQTPFEFNQPEHRFFVDPLPLTVPTFADFFSQQALGCYVLGHDAVADHHIHLHSRTADGSWTLDWTGRLALAYSGHETFEHRFRAHVTGVRLQEISLWWCDPTRAKAYFDLDVDPARTPARWLAPFVKDVGAFSFETRKNAVGDSAIYAVPRREPT